MKGTSIVTKRYRMSTDKPTHPGKILWRDFLQPLGISCYRLAQDINVPVNRITAIIRGQRRISPETGILLSRYFDLTDGLWYNLQATYETECAKETFKHRINKVQAINYATHKII